MTLSERLTYSLYILRMAQATEWLTRDLYREGRVRVGELVSAVRDIENAADSVGRIQRRMGLQ